MPGSAAGFAIAADFGARDGDLDAGVALDLALHLFVEIAFDFAHLAAAQASHVDVVAQAVAFVVVAMPVDVQQVELVEQAQALEHFQGAIDGDAVDVGVNLLRALQDGISAEMLFRLVHDFQQDPALARQAHSAPFQRQAQTARAGMSVDALAGGNALPMCGGNHGLRVRAVLAARAKTMNHWLGSSRRTSLYITTRKTNSRKTIPTVTTRSLILRLRSFRNSPSMPSIRMCPPSRMGMGSRLRTPRLRLTSAIKLIRSPNPLRAARLDSCTIPSGPCTCLRETLPVNNCPTRYTILLD